MYVKLGSTNAIETYYDEEGALRSRPLPGERTTTVSFPPEISLFEAFSTTLAALERHMEPGTTPVWIESDSKPLRKLLVEHFGLKITKADRPEGWGE